MISIAHIFPSASSEGGPCESIGDHNINWGALDSRKTCHMNSTVIDSKDFLITSDRDDAVEVFYAFENRKLEYLPRNLGDKFPNLLGLNAAHCSITEVSKESFKGLGKLLQLRLYGNQIEKFVDDTFEYIPAIVEIHLGKKFDSIVDGNSKLIEISISQIKARSKSSTAALSHRYTN